MRAVGGGGEGCGGGGGVRAVGGGGLIVMVWGRGVKVWQTKVI